MMLFAFGWPFEYGLLEFGTCQVPFSSISVRFILSEQRLAARSEPAAAGSSDEDGDAESAPKRGAGEPTRVTSGPIGPCRLAGVNRCLLAMQQEGRRATSTPESVS